MYIKLWYINKVLRPSAIREKVRVGGCVKSFPITIRLRADSLFILLLVFNPQFILSCIKYKTWGYIPMRPLLFCSKHYRLWKHYSFKKLLCLLKKNNVLGSRNKSGTFRKTTFFVLCESIVSLFLSQWTWAKHYCLEVWLWPGLVTFSLKLPHLVSFSELSII